MKQRILSFSVVRVLFLASMLLLSGFFGVANNAAIARGVSPATIVIMGVGDFVPDRTGIRSGDLPDGLAARIMERLTASRRFTVLERAALRRIVKEQKFGGKRPVTDLDRLMDKATNDLEKINAGTLAVAGVMADGNDILKDFQDLGSAAGADYLVYAKLEKLQRSTTSKKVVYSTSGRKIVKNKVDSRLYLRVIDVKKGSIAASISIRAKISESVFAGKTLKQDQFSIYDELGRKAAGKIIDILFPARVVSSNPWVLNRGVNDGVMVGDTYEVFREGEEVKGSGGLVLGRLKSSVGQIKLIQVQGTISIVEVVSGTIAKKDLAELKDSASVVAKSQKSARSGANLSNPKSKGKATLAVGKVQLNKRGKNALLSGAAINRVSNDLIVKLSQIGSFEVLERAEVDQILDEKEFVSITGGADMEESLSSLVGADYLITAVIDDFYIIKTTKRIEVLDEVQVVNKGIVEATLRIVDVHTGKVVAANKVRISEKLSPDRDRRQVVNDLVDQFTSIMVGKITSNIFPGKGDAMIKAARPSKRVKKIRKVSKPAF